MIIECPSCRAKYQYDEERFERKPSKKIRCAKCQQIFEIHNPAFASASARATADVGERTSTRRDETHTGRPKTEQDSTAQSPLPEKRDTGKAVGPQLPTGKRLSLAVLDGPDAGTVHRIDKPRITLGRSGADIVLNDSEASRQHAAVEIRDTLYTLADLGSTNGTLVNGQKIHDPVELTDKSEFQIGATTLMLIVTDDA